MRPTGREVRRRCGALADPPSARAYAGPAGAAAGGGPWQTRRVRTWGIAALAAACSLLAACSEGVPAPKAAPTPSATATRIAASGDVAAQQVLSLVPEQATILTVTDFARIRDQLGDDGQQAGIWERAEKTAPMLARGLFRDGGPGGIRQTDVLWEAHFTGGAEGYVVRFADTVSLAGVQPPQGAELRAAEHELVSGVATDPASSWASVAGLADLVPDAAEATYVQRGCLPGDGGAGLEALDAFSVEFGSTIATARLGPARHDLFLRMRLGDAEDSFAGGFADGSADPSTGRIGYRLADPVKAVDLTLRRRLPFAVCAS